MLTPDTIVPDPANPQSFNRYSYVNNNPVNLIDPTGHWSCSGREDCEDIVNIWVNLLRDAGDLGNELASYFESSDINVDFTDWIRTIMNSSSKNSINVHSSRVDNIVAEEGIFGHVLLMTFFGHELEHTRQGYIEARSVQAEYLGYKTQFELAENWDANTHSTVAIDMMIGKGSRNNKIYMANFVDWYSLGVDLDPNSHTDMQRFREHFLSQSDSYYSRIPALPLGDELDYQFFRATTPLRQTFTNATKWLYSLAYGSP